jgi:hypothetical protein
MRTFGRNHVLLAVPCGLLLAALAAAAEPAARPPLAEPINLSPTYTLPTRPTQVLTSPSALWPPPYQPAQVVWPTRPPSSRDPLERPVEPIRPLPPSVAATAPTYDEVLTGVPNDPPLGFSGPSGVLPRSGSNADFVTIEDRWRIGYPGWDRYGKGYPRVFDAPYELGTIRNPFNQNVLKGDYPILGQHTFLNITATNISIFEGREIPTATTPFESTARPITEDFFGRPGQFAFANFFFLSFDLFHGDAAFKPVDWRIKLTPAVNVNTLSVQELAVVSPDVRDGTVRNRGWVTLQEWFGEVKLADLSTEYDFLSLRVGSQFFSSDFRSTIFADTNRAVRLFGNLNGNRDQFNLVYFRQQEKDTFSGLNSFNDRDQNIVIANWYRQDFIFPGYTITGSVHYNNEGPDVQFDRAGFLVRPDPVGVFQPHRVEVAYLGFAGDGHIDRYNISHAFYWAVGRDSMNPLAGRPQSISAQMAALELSYDRDWARFRVTGFWQSGDGDVNNGRATGFDSILDFVNFAGEGSFFGRQFIPLFGVGLTQRQSLYADLRSSKIQGQSNFVNPGLWVVNGGVDFDLTPRLKMVNNANFMWFDKTNVLEQFVFQGRIDRDIGADLSTIFEWRPRLNNNIIVLSGVSSLIPSGGFRQLYNNLGGKVNPLVAGFVEVILQY